MSRIDNLSKQNNIVGDLEVDGSVITDKIKAHGHTLNLPTTTGASGYVLRTNGSGTLSWVAQSGGGSGGGDINDGGNATGTAITIGTNDGNPLVLKTNDTTALTLTATGMAEFANPSVRIADTNLTAPGSYSIVLPATQATQPGQALVNDGSGNLEWGDVDPSIFQYNSTLKDNLTVPKEYKVVVTSEQCFDVDTGIEFATPRLMTSGAELTISGKIVFDTAAIDTVTAQFTLTQPHDFTIEIGQSVVPFTTIEVLDSPDTQYNLSTTLTPAVLDQLGVTNYTVYVEFRLEYLDQEVTLTSGAFRLAENGLAYARISDKEMRVDNIMKCRALYTDSYVTVCDQSTGSGSCGASARILYQFNNTFQVTGVTITPGENSVNSAYLALAVHSQSDSKTYYYNNMILESGTPYFLPFDDPLDAREYLEFTFDGSLQLYGTTDTVPDVYPMGSWQSTNFTPYMVLSTRSRANDNEISDSVAITTLSHNRIAIKADPMSSNYDIVLPKTQGLNGQYLAVDNLGECEWKIPTVSRLDFSTTNVVTDINQISQTVNGVEVMKVTSQANAVTIHDQTSVYAVSYTPAWWDFEVGSDCEMSGMVLDTDGIAVPTVVEFRIYEGSGRDLKATVNAVFSPNAGYMAARGVLSRPINLTAGTQYSLEITEVVSGSIGRLAGSSGDRPFPSSDMGNPGFDRAEFYPYFKILTGEIGETRILNKLRINDTSIYANPATTDPYNIILPDRAPDGGEKLLMSVDDSGLTTWGDIKRIRYNDTKMEAHGTHITADVDGTTGAKFLRKDNGDNVDTIMAPYTLVPQSSTLGGAGWISTSKRINGWVRGILLAPIHAVVDDWVGVEIYRDVGESGDRIAGPWNLKYTCSEYVPPGEATKIFFEFPEPVWFSQQTPYTFKLDLALLGGSQTWDSTQNSEGTVNEFTGGSDIYYGGWDRILSFSVRADINTATVDSNSAIAVASTQQYSTTIATNAVEDYSITLPSRASVVGQVLVSQQYGQLAWEDANIPKVVTGVIGRSELDNAEIMVIPALGTDRIPIIESVTYSFIPGDSAYIGGSDLALYYNSGEKAFQHDLPAAFITDSTQTVYRHLAASQLPFGDSEMNVPVSIVITDAFTGGNGYLTYTIKYSVYQKIQVEFPAD